MKYIIYVRVSTTKQEVDAQISNILESIKSKLPDGTVFEHMCFSDPGTSSTRTPLAGRKGLQDAIRAVEKNDVFVSVSISRLARRLSEACIIRDAIHQRGGSIWLVNQPAIADSTLVWNILACIAEEEAKTISLNTRQAHKHTRSLGRVTGHTPFGYRAVADPVEKTRAGKPVKWLAVDEEEQKVLKLMIDLEASGWPYKKIAKEIAERGYVNRKGQPWCFVAVYQLLKNRQTNLPIAR